jgi:hypothetical protein
MYEASRLGARGALPCLNAQDHLFTVVSRLLKDERVLQENGRAIVFQDALPREPITSASTAIRTATPFRT